MTSYNQSIQFNASAVVTLRWPDFKSIIDSKNLPVQYITRLDSYAVFTLESNIAYVCTLILASESTGFPFDSDYNQTQNDLDVAEFETDYLPSANAQLVPKAASGVAGQAPARGLGGFAPNPSNNPYEPDADEIVGHYVDAEGQLMVRGPTMTDEGSLRDDFSGSALESDLTGSVTFTNGSPVVRGTGTFFTHEVNRDHYIKVKTDTVDKWVAVVRAPTDTSILLESPYLGTTHTGTAHKTRWIQEPIGGTPGTVTVTSSEVEIASGTVSGCGAHIHRDGDYLPMVSSWRVAISQRIANQVGFFGFRDDCDTPSMYCDILFTGTDNTKVTFRSAWDGDEESTTVSLPAGLNTSQSLRYKIDVSVDYCALLINGVLVAKHDNHVPDMYVEMALCAGIKNSSTVSSTILSVDTVYWSNQDQIQISSVFQAPIPVITREDQHHITGKKVTTTTTSDQTVLSYSVPAGKVFYLIGYSVDTAGTQSGIVKIGRNSVGTEPAAPGDVDGMVFRCFELSAGGTTGEVDFGGNPRKIGVGGDTILLTVTPSALLSATWRASLDFVLR